MSKTQVDNNSNPINYWFKDEKSLNLNKALWSEKFQPNLQYKQKMQLFKLNFQQSKENLLNTQRTPHQKQRQPQPQQQSIISQLHNFQETNNKQHQKAQSIDGMNQKTQNQQNFSFQSSSFMNNNINHNDQGQGQVQFQYTGTNNFSFKSFLDQMNNNDNDNFNELNNNHQHHNNLQHNNKNNNNNMNIQQSQNFSLNNNNNIFLNNSSQSKSQQKSQKQNEKPEAQQAKQRNGAQRFLTQSVNIMNSNLIKLQSTAIPYIHHDSNTNNNNSGQQQSYAKAVFTDRVPQQQSNILHSINLNKKLHQNHAAFQENNIILNINQQSESSINMSPKSFKLNLSINTKQAAQQNREEIKNFVQKQNEQQSLALSPVKPLSSQQLSDIQVQSNIEDFQSSPLREMSPIQNLSPQSINKKRSSLVNYKKMRSFVKESKFKTIVTTTPNQNNQDNSAQEILIMSPDKGQTQQMSPQFSPFSKTHSEIPASNNLNSILKLTSQTNLYKYARNQFKTVKTEISESKNLTNNESNKMSPKQVSFKKQQTFDVINYVSDFKNKLSGNSNNQSNINENSNKITRFDQADQMTNNSVKFQRKQQKQLTSLY